MTTHPRGNLVKQLFRAATMCLAGLGLLVVAITVTPLTGWWTSKLAGTWNDPRGDVLVVLSADANNDTIGFDSYWRAVYAVRVYREGSTRKIVLTGGAIGGSETIAQTMAKFLESQGVPQDAIVSENHAMTTRENALFTKPLLASLAGRKVLLTSDFHMWRAIRTFRKTGIDIEPRPIPDLLKQAANWRGRWPAFLGLLTESSKIAYYYLRGWI